MVDLHGKKLGLRVMDAQVVFLFSANFWASKGSSHGWRRGYVRRGKKEGMAS